MYAIVKTGGKQYKVNPGDTIMIDKLDGEAGTDIILDKVLMIVDDDKDSVTVGTPLVEGATVSAQISRQTKGSKIIVFKSKRRKGYRKKQGHRQLLTAVTIKDITVQ